MMLRIEQWMKTSDYYKYEFRRSPVLHERLVEIRECISNFSQLNNESNEGEISAS